MQHPVGGARAAAMVTSAVTNGLPSRSPPTQVPGTMGAMGPMGAPKRPS
ncbi:MAG: hypothetical protein R3F59_37090 [Myxococcota bacterium]